MVRLTPEQADEYEELGFVVIDVPWAPQLTEECLAATALLQSAATPEEVSEIDTIGNHWRLKPITPGSYWSAVDHSLPYLSIITHPEVVEIGQQLAGEDNVWVRNAGLNELAPGRGVFWHHDGGDDTVEFMHYPQGATKENGCLRVIPGSHKGPTVARTAAEALEQGTTEYDELLQEIRTAEGVTKPTLRDGPEDVAMPGEVFVEVRPDQLLVRSTRIFHATMYNRTPE
eukprot:COSAG06_NODE_245_length_19176_cov_167.625151_3_plen_229_part_00